MLCVGHTAAHVWHSMQISMLTFMISPESEEVSLQKGRRVYKTLGHQFLKVEFLNGY